MRGSVIAENFGAFYFEKYQSESENSKFESENYTEVKELQNEEKVLCFSHEVALFRH